MSYHMYLWNEMEAEKRFLMREKALEFSRKVYH
jgi:hypothetical protein